MVFIRNLIIISLLMLGIRLLGSLFFTREVFNSLQSIETLALGSLGFALVMTIFSNTQVEIGKDYINKFSLKEYKPRIKKLPKDLKRSDKVILMDRRGKEEVDDEFDIVQINCRNFKDEDFRKIVRILEDFE